MYLLENAAATGAQGAQAGGATMIIYLVLIVVFFYFFMIRPQKKQEKQTAQMRNSLEIGDTVTTRGGIVGSVTGIRDDIITIETGASKVRITVQRWAIASREEKMHN